MSQLPPPWHMTAQHGQYWHHADRHPILIHTWLSTVSLWFIHGTPYTILIPHLQLLITPDLSHDTPIWPISSLFWQWHNINTTMAINSVIMIYIIYDTYHINTTPTAINHIGLALQLSTTKQIKMTIYQAVYWSMMTHQWCIYDPHRGHYTTHPIPLLLVII